MAGTPAQQQARNAALGRLADLHPTEYLRLLNDERSGRGLAALPTPGASRRSPSPAAARVRARVAVYEQGIACRILPAVGDRLRIFATDDRDTALSVLANRLALHVTVRGTDCWPWTSTLDGHGYGTVSVRGTRQKAHRVAYEVWVGDIPGGLTIDHVRARGCVLKHCCNPAHLEPVTRGVNAARAEHREDCTCIRCRHR